jgi:hypothetical protein
MQENDPIAHGYNFEAIAAESVRHENRKEAVEALQSALENSSQSELSISQELKAVAQSMLFIDGTFNPYNLAAYCSPVYDSDTVHRVEIESKIISISNHPTRKASGMALLALNMMPDTPSLEEEEDKNKMYLIAATAKGQTSIATFNLCYGALVHEDGNTVFFKLKKYGELDEEEKPIVVKQVAAKLGVEDSIADKTLVAVPTKPDKEQLIISEFSKVVLKIKQKNNEKDKEESKEDASVSKEIQANMQELGLDPTNQQHIQRMKLKMPQLFFED